MAMERMLIFFLCSFKSVVAIFVLRFMPDRVSLARFALSTINRKFASGAKRFFALTSAPASPIIFILLAILRDMLKYAGSRFFYFQQNNRLIGNGNFLAVF